MKIQNLIKKLKKEKKGGYYYLASPYNGSPNGYIKAHKQICEIAGELLKNEIVIFCPISHSHSISRFGKVKEVPDVWLPIDIQFMRYAKGIIVTKMDGWNKSVGVIFELKYFKGKNKPIYYLDT